MESLVGRKREISGVNELLDGVTDRGAALVVRGGAGVGKSALLASTSAQLPAVHQGGDTGDHTNCRAGGVIVSRPTPSRT
jgi:hypothetical protein